MGCRFRSRETAPKARGLTLIKQCIHNPWNNCVKHPDLGGGAGRNPAVGRAGLDLRTEPPQQVRQGTQVQKKPAKASGSLQDGLTLT